MLRLIRATLFFVDGKGFLWLLTGHGLYLIKGMSEKCWRMGRNRTQERVIIMII
jgi:hypothetical protein